MVGLVRMRARALARSLLFAAIAHAAVPSWFVCRHRWRHLVQGGRWPAQMACPSAHPAPRRAACRCGMSAWGPAAGGNAAAAWSAELLCSTQQQPCCDMSGCSAREDNRLHRAARRRRAPCCAQLCAPGFFGNLLGSTACGASLGGSAAARLLWQLYLGSSHPCGCHERLSSSPARWPAHRHNGTPAGRMECPPAGACGTAVLVTAVQQALQHF